MKRVIFQEARTYSEHRGGAAGPLPQLPWLPGLLAGAGALLWRRSKHRPCPPPSPAAPAGIDSTRHNYLLLGLAIFQFPLNAWLARLPPLPPAAAAAASGAAAQAAGLM